MKCEILRAADDYVLNVRHTDEIGENYGMTDQQIDDMERELRSIGRFWLDADTFARPVKRAP